MPETRNKQAPEAAELGQTIEQAKQELQHMIDLNPQVMLLVDGRGTVIRANRALLEFLGMPDFRKVLRRKLKDLFHCRDEQFLDRLLGNRGGYDADIAEVVLSPDNSRHLRFSVVNSGADVSVVIVDDMTGERQQAEHLEKKHKKEAVQAIVGGLMHNINQPLTVMLVQAQLMQMSLESGRFQPEKLNSDLDNMMRLTMQIAEMLRNVEKPRDFVTEPYVAGVSILDLKRSAGGGAPPPKLGHSVLDIVMASLEAHQPGSHLHAVRTSRWAGIIGERLGLSGKEKGVVERCAFFHDIGKIGVPDALLRKPEALTEAETALMKSHVEIGHRLLGNFPFFADEAITAWCHHKWHDGRGYPEEVPPGNLSVYTRVTAVADAFDALRFDRSYHAGLSLAETLEKIKDRTGTQFDPEAVKAFQSCAKELDGVPAVNARP